MMTHGKGKVRGCHMARQECDTWHKKGMAHIEPHGWHDSMAHIKPCRV